LAPGSTHAAYDEIGDIAQRSALVARGQTLERTKR
jgi:hypothetical protein